MYYFIVNPISGGGRGKKVWAALQHTLEHQSVEYRAWLLRRRGEAREIAAGLSKLKHDYTAVIVGGDGTIDEFIDGLGSLDHITLGCIPTGSGNDFVRGLALPTDPAAALDMILHPQTIRRLKVGTVLADRSNGTGPAKIRNDIGPADSQNGTIPADSPNGTGPAKIRNGIGPADSQNRTIPADSSNGTVLADSRDSSPLPQAEPRTRCRHSFIVSSGIGFDADVCNGVCRSGLKQFLNLFHLGKLVYLTTALRMLISMKQYRMKATLSDGSQLSFEKMFFTAVMNLSYEGGGFRFAPDADPEDDCFQVCIAHSLTRRRILCLLPLALDGRHVGKEGVRIFPCRSLTLEFPVPLCLHTDGEVIGFFDRVTFGARPQRLPVITG